jgi:hypothetical protein
MDELTWLQSWYVEQCDGDWEHSFGVHIGTLDNPGWSLDIDLAETPLEDLVRPNHFEERDENDWIAYEFKERKFIGHCGPRNLSELIRVFQQVWMESASAATEAGSREPGAGSP